MPVRIYDISRKLGLENKVVLAKARELGFTAAKVASSTIDKITAEYLEQQLRADYADLIAAATQPAPAEKPPEPPPEPASPRAVEAAEQPAAKTEFAPSPAAVMPPAQPAVIEEPVIVPPQLEVAQPAEPAAAATTQQEIQPPAPAAAETAGPSPPEPPATRPEPATIGTATLPTGIATETTTAPPADHQVVVVIPPTTPQPLQPPQPTLPPPPPPPPPVPPPPKLGEKVGQIELPPRTATRSTQKATVPKRGATTADKRTEAITVKTDRGTKPGSTGTTVIQPPPRPGPKVQVPTGNQPKVGQHALPPLTLPETSPLITIKPPITVRMLADKLNQKPFKVIADLIELNVFANVNQTLDEQMAKRVCAKYGYRLELEKRGHGPAQVVVPKKVDLDAEDRPQDLKPRPPVVTIMGHVDHGKTTLLDVIRKSNVAAGEAGGITQHIGAYTISVPHPERKNELAQITFLDTPGHAAFTSMRARGANVTDIVVLVVAANDGVMPQTLEALNHARAAKVPILVAVNKIDHPNANPLRVRQQLKDNGLVPDDWGGDTLFTDVSALTKKGVDRLLELILFQADLLELKANPNRRAKGYVIESGLAPGGPTATALVRNGTLRVGDVILCGQYYGKVRALINEEGKRLKEAGPSVAVKVLGLNGVPEAGLQFTVEADEKTAKELAEQRKLEARDQTRETKAKVTLENLFRTLEAQQSKNLKVVVKADTQGSVEAITDALKEIKSEKVTLAVIHSAVGTITESDVLLASASHAVVLGFHTRIDTGVAELAKREGVQIKLYTIIYELIDEVKAAMAGLLEPVIREVVLGSAEVRQVFTLSKGQPVAGCMVTHGRIVKGRIRVRRRREVIHEGVTQSLRRFQDEVSEVRAGLECGIRIEGFGQFQPGDVLECYTIEKIAQQL